METIFNITDYGAIGDGTVDCTEAVQNALNDAATCSGKVIVPPGRYLVGHLEMKGQGVSLQGTPAWSYRSPGASVFELIDAEADSLINITGAFGCSIRGMSFVGNHIGNRESHPIHGIYLCWDKYNGGSEEDTPSIIDCKIDGFSGDGIHLERVWCFRIRHSMMCYCHRNGLFIDGWDGFVLDNWFSYNEGYGIRGGNVVASLTAVGNRVEWNIAGGFRFPFGDSFVFTGNFFDRGHGPAIDLGGEKNVSLVTMTGNIFRRSGACEVGEGESAEDSSHVRLVNCSNSVVANNTMRVGRNDGGGGIISPEFGIIIRDCHECIVKDNAMMTAALKKLIVSEHNINTEISGNVGTIADEDTSTGSPLLN